MLLRPALDRYSPIYVTTNAKLGTRDGLVGVRVLPDCNRDQPSKSLRSLWHSFRLVWKSRPNLLVTTGALPGLFCLIGARLLGAKTIWIDSVANSDGPSLSGRFAKPFSTLWLAQWPHLADGRDVLYGGSLL
ncbi:glycosyltransferase family protein [Stakelama tenebrarum]|nr:glucuronosyltransferase [Sphingosinithalassobacter tenebrarum]